MPEWPAHERCEPTQTAIDKKCVRYERARADAWEARCRLAEKSLRWIAQPAAIPNPASEYERGFVAAQSVREKVAQAALDAILPIPAKPEAEG